MPPGLRFRNVFTDHRGRDRGDIIVDIEPMKPGRVDGWNLPLFPAAGGENGELPEVGFKVVAVRLRVESIVPIDDAACAVFADEEVDRGGVEVLGGLGGDVEEQVFRGNGDGVVGGLQDEPEAGWEGDLIVSLVRELLWHDPEDFVDDGSRRAGQFDMGDGGWVKGAAKYGDATTLLLRTSQETHSLLSI